MQVHCATWLNRYCILSSLHWGEQHRQLLTCIAGIDGIGNKAFEAFLKQQASTFSAGKEREAQFEARIIATTGTNFDLHADTAHPGPFDVFRFDKAETQALLQQGFATCQSAGRYGKTVFTPVRKEDAARAQEMAHHWSGGAAPGEVLVSSQLAPMCQSVCEQRARYACICKAIGTQCAVWAAACRLCCQYQKLSSINTRWST